MENGIAQLDCSLADQHVSIANFGADASAHCSACTRCRAGRGHYGRDPVLGGHAFVNKAHAPVALHREEGVKETEGQATKRGIIFAYALSLNFPEATASP